METAEETPTFENGNSPSSAAIGGYADGEDGSDRYTNWHEK
jgi:hypothetical protein